MKFRMFLVLLEGFMGLRITDQEAFDELEKLVEDKKRELEEEIEKR